MPIERPRPGCALLLILAAGVACGQPRSEFVDPTTTGPGIRPLLELPGATLRDLRHFVAIDSSSSNGFLYLHLAGSGGLPENSQRLALFAAARGYATVSLAYPNWPSVAALTGSLGDPAAPGAVRAERLFGVDASALVEVDAANAVANRLVRLLLHQHAAHPAEGWDRFLDGDQPRWSRIVVGGHSQGAGHAAYLAQEFPLAGALLLAGPGDAVAGAGSRPGCCGRCASRRPGCTAWSTSWTLTLPSSRSPRASWGWIRAVRARTSIWSHRPIGGPTA